MKKITDENTSAVVEDEMEVRRQKLAKWRVSHRAYPNHFHPTHTAQALHDIGDGGATQGGDALYAIAGRIMTCRRMGKASFLHLQDRSGRIQIYVRANTLKEDQYAAFLTWDLGDIIGVKGHLFTTKTGELTVHAQDVLLLSKSLHPLPDKFHGLQDQETRYRQRYLDLITRPQVRQVFMIRSQLIQAIRAAFLASGFLEVETPMMHAIAGGANARPFQTHHNTLDISLYLRIAPELYLKRLLVGGMEKVFELNRNFRNEGMSTRHNPEFTMLEFYEAYADYIAFMDKTEALLRQLCQSVLGTLQVTYQAHVLDFDTPFARLTVEEAVLRAHPSWTVAQLRDAQSIATLAAQYGVVLPEAQDVGKILVAIFEKTVEKTLIQPTFITGYPASVSPLARRSENDPTVTDRFELFIAGQEIANGFSELNDPEDQAARFKEQVRAQHAGDEEAMHYDADYILALEHAMPPAAGAGIGIDRLVMLLTNSVSIKDVILFPLQRPKLPTVPCETSDA